MTKYAFIPFMIIFSSCSFFQTAQFKEDAKILEKDMTLDIVKIVEDAEGITPNAPTSSQVPAK